MRFSQNNARTFVGVVSSYLVKIGPFWGGVVSPYLAKFGPLSGEPDALGRTFVPPNVHVSLQTRLAR